MRDPMNPADWRRLKEWFGDVLDAPERREEILAHAELESAALAAELRALLAEHDAPSLDASAVLAQAPSAVEAHAPGAPDVATIGPYRILRELGRGGTGVVFLAERQDDEFHRPVALKVLRFVAWNQRTRELLTEERRALARLQHANIATLLDWSTTTDDTPWLAMEYVEGQPIDAYCHDRKLGLSRTLDIFEQACAAVQYAHQRLIVHRDLKPGNILVTADGTVKLLDFGISQHLEDATTPHSTDRRFTPAYASPEQINGDPITATSDVFSLGLILRELLGALHTGGTDLELVVQRALELLPERRYPSVEQFAADLRRFREGRPVTAHPPSRWYVTRRFVQRNKWGVLSATLTAAALIIGATVALWQAGVARREQREAEARFEDVRTLAHWVIFDGHDALRRLPGTVAVRRDLLAKAVEYLDRLSAVRSGDDALQREVAQAYIRVGYSQGGLTGTNLGNSPASRTAYRSALRILDDLWARHPNDATIGTARFAAAYNLAMLERDPAEGVELATRYGNEAIEWSARDTSAAPLMAVELTQMARARALRTLGKHDEALRAIDRALNADSAMLPRTHTDRAPRPMFGTSVERSQNRFDTGLAWFVRTEILLDQQRTQEAVASAQTSRDLFAEARRIGLGGPSDERMLARVHGLLAKALLATGDAAKLSAAHEAATIELRVARVNVADGNATSQRDLGEAEQHAGQVAMARGDRRSAIAHFNEGRAIFARLVASDSTFGLNRRLLEGVERDVVLAGGRSGRE